MTLLQTEHLQKRLQDNSLVVPKDAQEKMLRYLQLMRDWNRISNLTSVTDPKEMILLHLIDSLSISAYLYGNRIVDVGTGAGLPGIPLAIANPEKTFTLIDSNNKKTRFVQQAVYELSLNNVEVIHTRVEAYQPTIRFDSILSRAFSSLKVMLESTTHFIHPQGQYLAMKGTYPEAEINEMPESFKLIGVHKLSIKGLKAERHLVCIGKK